jgi:hypothetical protein
LHNICPKIMSEVLRAAAVLIVICMLIL